MEMVISVEYDGYCYGALRCTYTNGEEREEHSFHLMWVKQTVECRKVKVNSIKDEFYADQHGNHVAACDEAEYADKEKYRTEYEETFYWYHNLFVLLLIT